VSAAFLVVPAIALAVGWWLARESTAGVLARTAMAAGVVLAAYGLTLEILCTPGQPCRPGLALTLTAGGAGAYTAGVVRLVRGR